MELGLERTGGFRTVWQCETDEYARGVLDKHWPGVERFRDIRGVAHFPLCDVLAGGFPCTDVSGAGPRVGIKGPRSGLWKEMARVVRDVGPRYVVVENVADLLHRGLDEVLGDLASCGYDAEWDCLPAAAVGAPHLRDRIFVVAYPNGAAGRPPERATVASDRGEAVREGAPESGRRRSALPDADGDEHKGRPHAGWRTREGAGGPLVFGRPVRAEVEWEPEPAVGRVAHGVPHRVDRLRCLGNAVVPQVARIIGERILARERALNG